MRRDRIESGDLFRNKVTKSSLKGFSVTNIHDGGGGSTMFLEAATEIELNKNIPRILGSKTSDQCRWNQSRWSKNGTPRASHGFLVFVCGVFWETVTLFDLEIFNFQNQVLPE